VKLPVVPHRLVKLHWQTPSEEAVRWSVAENVMCQRCFCSSVRLPRAAARHNKSMLLNVETLIFFNDMSWK